ncbi:MAG: formyltransferase family protein, partial [Sulfuritalea sp.]|nr:formyltransferase family protein [Sulfuritalea sp.]
AALQPDFLFSFYYRLMLKAPLLNLPKSGAWNMHGSLLPKYRGRVPVNWAIIHGEHETGATLHRMVDKPDAGGILARQAVPILPDDTAFEVFNKVTLAAEMALDSILPDLLAGRAVAIEQDLRTGSYFGGRKAEDGRIDWSKPAAAVHNLIRAVAPPYPGAFSDTARGRLRVLRSLHPSGAIGPYGGQSTLFANDGRLYAECGDGRLLRLLAVELDGLPLAPESADDQLNAIFGTPTLSLS